VPNTFSIGGSSRAGATRGATWTAARWAEMMGLAYNHNRARVEFAAGNQRRAAVPAAESSTAGAARGRGAARAPAAWTDAARAINMERINAQYNRARAEALAGKQPMHFLLLPPIYP
jgi:hypothetical protein